MSTIFSRERRARLGRAAPGPAPDDDLVVDAKMPGDVFDERQVRHEARRRGLQERDVVGALRVTGIELPDRTDVEVDVILLLDHPQRLVGRHALDRHRASI